jgi:hypothetical protein
MRIHVQALAVAALAAALSVPAASAGDVTAQIPFGFAVNGAEMPPGRYTFKDGNGPLVVSGATRTTVVLTLGVTSHAAGRPRIVFAKSGGAYVLSEAWSGSAGRQLPARKVERELARLARGGRVATVERVVVPGL